MKNGLIIDEFGNKSYYLNDRRHREDGPAFENINGDKQWMIHGETHRDGNLPAIEWATGKKNYYINGRLHRENGPAIEFSDGDKEYYLNGERYFEEAYYWEEIKRRKSLNYILTGLNNLVAVIKK